MKNKIMIVNVCFEDGNAYCSAVFKDKGKSTRGCHIMLDDQSIFQENTRGGQFDRLLKEGRVYSVCRHTGELFSDIENVYFLTFEDDSKWGNPEDVIEVVL